MGLTWFQSATQCLPRIAAIGCGVLAIAAVSASVALAAVGPPPSAPEIDPGSATSALALLAGGVLLLKSRFRR